MSISPFRLAGTVGRTYDVSGDDTRRTKLALRRLGYFKTPDYGLTDTPDDALFGAIEAFQRAGKLAVDGVMKPDGPTVAKLGQALQLAILPDQRRSARPAQLGTPAWPPGTASRLLSGDPQEAFQRAHTTQLAMQMKPRTGVGRYPATEGSYVRSPWGMMGGGGGGHSSASGPITGAGIAAAVGKAISDIWAKTPAKRTEIADPPPSTPPLEPDKEPRGDKEEYPADPPKMPTLGGRPINVAMKNDPLIFKMVDEKLRKAMAAPLYSHRGDQDTQDWNDEIVNEICPRVLRENWGPDYLDRIKHTGGAHDPKGRTKKEKYLPNADTDGKVGSSNVDITYGYSPELGGEFDRDIHLNTGRTWKDGRTPVASEQRQLDKLAKNAAGDIIDFMPKFRPGMDRKELVRRAEEVCFRIFSKAFGTPTRAK